MNKILRSFAIFALVVTLLIPSNIFLNSAKFPFKDVKENYWFYNAVNYCYENKIFSGMSDTEFKPSATMTREMLVTALAQLSNIDPKNYKNTYFRDVKSNAWYEPYVTWAYETGVSTGIGNKRFGIGKPVTRAEAVTMLYNYTNAMNLSNNYPSAENQLTKYIDKNKIPSYAEAAFGWAIAEGIVSGMSANTLSPRAEFNRAQAAQIFMQYNKLTLPEKDSYINLTLKPDTGFDIFVPYETSYSYRYGPSIIVNEDGSIDSYYAGLGSQGSGSLHFGGGYKEWDHITYTHITADGKILPEETVLQPTPDSYDFLSCCDPGAVYFNGYYYIGYTSTIHRTGLCNNVFVARSLNPDGPYEKWNGSGWGGDAEPIMMYDGSNLLWGEGEPAFVELDGTLYIYYTLKGQHGFKTMVATADATDEDWPLTIVKKGPALDQGNAQSGADFKYVESQRKFIGIAIENSFGDNSYIRIFESLDGITYTETQKIYEGVYKYAHNIGLSGDKHGHIKDTDKVYIAYAYADAPQSENWGQWATHMMEVELTTSKNTMTTDSGENEFHQFDTIPVGEWRTIAVSNLPHHFNINVGKTEKVKIYRINSRYNRQVVEGASLVTFEIEDEDIATIDGFTITAKAVGATNITATYDGCSITFPVNVHPEDVNVTDPEITEFRTVHDVYTVGAGEHYPHQIRAYISCGGIKWGEAFNDTSSSAVYHADDYPITYTVADPTVLRVDENGMVYGHKAGETTVTLTMGEWSYTVKVIVK